MTRPIVYLIGAGPGNPRLITVRGMECLRRADVVIYDRLGTSRLLREVRPGAELIYVGKAAGMHALPQSEINQLLVRKAEEGKVVARLKGGDPYLFGRGGEEAAVLVSRGILYEVVPGVTSAISVPAYAGIPVTHRNCTSSLTIVTGHERPDKEQSTIDWAALGAGTGTLVFLMGLANLGGIVRRLIELGRPPETPVALISSGTSHNQVTVAGTLANIEEEVARVGVPSPTVIVVGEVVGLRSTLRWFEDRPLAGRRVAVVRRWDDGADVTEQIDTAGGEALEVVVVHGGETASDRIARCARQLAAADFVIFPAAEAVEGFFAALGALGLDSRVLAGCSVAVRESGAYDALVKRGIRADVTPDTRSDLLGALREFQPGAFALAGGQAVAAWVEMLGEHRAELMAVPAVCLDRETALKVKALGVEGLWPGEGAWLQQLSQCCQGQAPGEEAATVTAS